MKKLLLLAIAGSMLALSGCKTEINAPVKYSELFGPQKTIIGSVSVQVPSCTDSSNKFESNSVMEAKQKIPYIFPEAKYLQCKDKDFESYATFNIPLQVGGKLKQCKPNQICVFTEESVPWVDVKIGDEVLKKSKELAKTDIDGNDVKIWLTITNDTGKELELYVPAAFITGIPVYMSTITLSHDAANFGFLLNNVATGFVIDGHTASFFKDNNREKDNK